MNWLERTNRAIEYIEDHLLEEISYDEVAKIACCSTYHFSRMFASITDVTLSEYIRRRRLSLAAFELQNSDIKILDLAVKYGYDSADSFSRAFQKIHKIRPSLARCNGVQLKNYPKISFQITIKGDVEMEYRIEEFESEFFIVGVKKKIKVDGAFDVVPTLWANAQKEGLVEKLIEMSWEKPQCKLESLLGVSGETAEITSEEFEYLMGVRYEGETPENMVKIKISPSKWAVFPNDDVKIWKRIYTEWIPTSEYELGDMPCIECFYPPDSSPQKEIWVPIVKR